MSANDPKPCKTCGTCPTCGKAPQQVYPWPYPYVRPYPYVAPYGGYPYTPNVWYSASQSVAGQAISQSMANTLSGALS